MSPPIDGSIEAIFDKWADMDTFIITHEIVTDDKGGTKKVKVSEELSECVLPPALERPLDTVANGDETASSIARTTSVSLA